MADAKLSVEIGADIENLRRGLGHASKDLNNFSNNTNKKLSKVGEKVFDKLNQELRIAQGNFELFGNEITSDVGKLNAYKKALNGLVGGGFNPTSKEALKVAGSIEVLNNKISNPRGLVGGSNRAAYALTNLSRVAQDAPFGFIGIQNNLNPLLESFQSLRRESTSNVDAFKKLGSSLLGAGGIGLALGVVSAAVLIYQKYAQGAKKETEAVTDALKEYVDGLKGLEAVQLKGISNAQKETTTLQQLYKASQDTSLSIGERNKAAVLLQQTYPATFANFTKEQILLGQADEGYKALTKSIIAQATVKAASDKVAEQSIKKLEIETKLNSKNLELSKAITKESKETNDARSQGGGTGAGFAGASSGNIVAALKAKNATKDRKKIESEINALTFDRFKTDLEIFKLNEFITKEIEAQGVAVLGLDSKTPGGGSTSNQTIKVTPRIKLEGIDLEGISKEQSKIAKEINAKVSPIIRKLADEGIIERQFVPVPISIDFVNPEITSESELALERAFEEYAPKLASAFSAFADNAIPDGLAAFGSALATGGNPIEAFGTSILSSFGDFLTNFGKLLIQYGIAGTAFSTATKAMLNPLTAAPSSLALIAAGIALSVAGGAIKGALSGGGSQKQGGYQTPRFAGGVTGYRGGLAMVGERGPELVNLPRGSNVITNQNTRSLIKGGNENDVNVNFGGAVIRGSDLYIAVQRGAKELGRTI